MSEFLHSQYLHGDVVCSRRGWSRRTFLQTAAASTFASGAFGFRDLMAVRADELRKQGMSLILLWMQGGPSQLETFDPKPGTENGGPTTAIETAVSGIRLAEGWTNLSKQMSDVCLIRSMTNKEGQHQRATFQMHTGYLPTGTVRYPNVGCAIAKEIAPTASDLPAVVSVGPTEGSGFLGVDYEPFVVQSPGQMPRNVSAPVASARFGRRLGLLGELEADFAAKGAEEQVRDHKLLYEKTARLVQSPKVRAFDFADELAETRAMYGDSQFGKGCLLARRLIETGVTFVEVRHGNWDTHQDNFDKTKELIGPADAGFAALVTDLRQRGLLDKTLVVCAGEFGRTPKINPRNGRDHYPRVYSVALAGGGVKGGQVIGASTDDGMAIKDSPVAVNDLLTSICHALKVDSQTENISPLGRPIKIVDGGTVVPGLFA
jgi:uncharacterized protein (DUF1501 family)